MVEDPQDQVRYLSSLLNCVHMLSGNSYRYTQARLCMPVFDGGDVQFFIFLDPDRLKTTVNQRFYHTRFCGSKMRVVPNRFCHQKHISL